MGFPFARPIICSVLPISIRFFQLSSIFPISTSFCSIVPSLDRFHLVPSHC